MSFIFTNGTTGEQVKSDTQQTCEEVLKLIGQMKTPNSVLITMLPSGLGVDFNLQDNGTFWVEFYSDELSSAFVSRPVAEEIVKRAFADGNKKIKEKYADLILEWEN